MNYLKLRDDLEQVLAGKKDGLFTHIVDGVHCMSRPRVYAVINAIVSAMNPGEIYLEVGTYQGGSLIAALANNEAQAIGVDSFSEFTETNSLEITRGNLDRFGVGNRVDLKNMGFKEFFAQVDPGFRAAVYYYDGAHDYETQLAGLEAAWPFLQTDSLIIVDDYTYPEVIRSINQFVANHIDRVKFQFVVAVLQNNDEIYWNGIVVLRVI